MCAFSCFADKKMPLWEYARLAQFLKSTGLAPYQVQNVYPLLVEQEIDLHLLTLMGPDDYAAVPGLAPADAQTIQDAIAAGVHHSVPPRPQGAF